MQNEEHDIAALKQRFLDIYKTNIKREGADKLLDYLLSPKSDFFTAPASTRYHGSYEGGLLQHSLNVYDCLRDYMDRPRVKELYNLTADDETIALISLLHDLCKVNFYKTDYRNAKNDQGVWEKVPYYTIDDTLPYGHGEKSVYIIRALCALPVKRPLLSASIWAFQARRTSTLWAEPLRNFPLPMLSMRRTWKQAISLKDE